MTNSSNRTRRRTTISLSSLVVIVTFTLLLYFVSSSPSYQEQQAFLQQQQQVKLHEKQRTKLQQTKHSFRRLIDLRDPSSPTLFKPADTATPTRPLDTTVTTTTKALERTGQEKASAVNGDEPLPFYFLSASKRQKLLNQTLYFYFPLQTPHETILQLTLYDRNKTYPHNNNGSGGNESGQDEPEFDDGAVANALLLFQYTDQEPTSMDVLDSHVSAAQLHIGDQALMFSPSTAKIRYVYCRLYVPPLFPPPVNDSMMNDIFDDGESELVDDGVNGGNGGESDGEEPKLIDIDENYYLAKRSIFHYINRDGPVSVSLQAHDDSVYFKWTAFFAPKRQATKFLFQLNNVAPLPAHFFAAMAIESMVTTDKQYFESIVVRTNNSIYELAVPMQKSMRYPAILSIAIENKNRKEPLSFVVHSPVDSTVGGISLKTSITIALSIVTGCVVMSFLAAVGMYVQSVVQNRRRARSYRHMKDNYNLSKYNDTLLMEQLRGINTELETMEPERRRTKSTRHAANVVVSPSLADKLAGASN